ncbi:MAG: DUF481 domain-containing protein [Bryobacteraceae bacterium]
MRQLISVPTVLLLATMFVGGTGAQELDVLTPAGATRTVFYGRFVSADGNGVTFHTDADVDITLPWEKVNTLEVHESLFARATTGAEQTTPPMLAINATRANGTMVLSGLALSVDKLSTLVPATERAAVLKAVWDVSVSPSFSLAYGDQVVQTWGTQVMASRTQNPTESGWRHQQTSLTLDANNTLTEQPGSSTRVHEYDGELAHVIYLGQGWYSTVIGNGYHNSAQNVYVQQYYGGGIGKRLEARETIFEFTVAPVYVGQHFYGAPSKGFAGMKLYQDTTFLLGQTKAGSIDLIETTSYIPAINASKAWQIRGTSSLTIPITSQLSFVTSFTDDYLEDAPGRKNYSNTSVGISFTLLPGH